MRRALALVLGFRDRTVGFYLALESLVSRNATLGRTDFLLRYGFLERARSPKAVGWQRCGRLRLRYPINLSKDRIFGHSGSTAAAATRSAVNLIQDGVLSIRH